MDYFADAFEIRNRVKDVYENMLRRSGQQSCCGVWWECRGGGVDGGLVKVEIAITYTGCL